VPADAKHLTIAVVSRGVRRHRFGVQGRGEFARLLSGDNSLIDALLLPFVFGVTCDPECLLRQDTPLYENVFAIRGYRLLAGAQYEYL
jgi:hypothetical protein